MSSSQFKTFSQKQLELLTWWCAQSPYRDRDAIICDGAVRSGKTVCMSLSFVFWAFYRFSEQSFALCGKTITGLRRNVVTPLLPILKNLGFTFTERRAANVLEITLHGRTNRFYLFGGRDESSAALIQGMTLAGVMLDEAALMPRSFCEQAIARCSVEGSRLLVQLQPRAPRPLVLQRMDFETRGEKLFISPLQNGGQPLAFARYARNATATFTAALFTAALSRANGLRVTGLFTLFSTKPCSATRAQGFDRFIVSCDYGTVNPTSMGLWGRKEGVWYRIDEFYHSSKQKGFQMTDEEYYRSLCTLVGLENGGLRDCRPVCGFVHRVYPPPRQISGAARAKRCARRDSPHVGRAQKRANPHLPELPGHCS